jgi:hypothetical protein
LEIAPARTGDPNLQSLALEGDRHVPEDV